MHNQSVRFLSKLSDQLKKDNRLEKLTSLFENNDQFHAPAFGVEIEFYLSKNIDPISLGEKFGHLLKPEKGDHQFEIDLPPSYDLADYAKYINTTRQNLQDIAKSFAGDANLQSKPHLDDYGSSMHFNLSFTHDPKILDFAAKSLCQFMLNSFLVFMPEAYDYERLSEQFMAPTHVAYGGNNRTTAIRIPGNGPLRLEHRVSSSLCDPYLVMVTILTSVLKGFKTPSKVSNFQKIYGNAYDAQYHLIPLPKDINQATELFELEFFDYPF
jgi:glutamine synthetase